MDGISYIILIVIFISSTFCLVYSYFIFPLILKFISRNKKNNSICFKHLEELPHVTLLMSLHNEEKIIEEKLNSLIKQKYPLEKLNIFIGSDNSNDDTNKIVANFIQKYKLEKNYFFFPFKNRQGKPGVINSLVKKAFSIYPKNKNHILIITDASVILSEDTTFHLVKHFKNPNIGLVDSHMKHTGLQQEGISQSEDQYISNEVTIKYHENISTGKMMGPFGGCYALRSTCFVPVPSNFLVDDFFLAMKVLEQGKDNINDLDAICQESVSHNIQQEYRRKVRISSGNFQNLSTFKHLLLPHKKSIAFNFLSHKVLRWLGPFFIILSFVSNLFLCLSENIIFIILFSFQVGLIFLIPILDLILQKLSINIHLFRSIRYFFVMNFALLQGLIRYLKGIKSNVWQPTERPDTTEHHP